MAAPCPREPHLLGEYDYATGNTHRDPERIGTFDQQYPSNHNAFGLVDLFAFQNIKQYRLNMDLKPYPHLTLLFQAESLHVATRYDGLYDSAGSLSLRLRQPVLLVTISAQDSMRRRSTCITSPSSSRLVLAISSHGRL
jgi:hypothetical protein